MIASITLKSLTAQFIECSFPYKLLFGGKINIGSFYYAINSKEIGRAYCFLISVHPSVQWSHLSCQQDSQ